MNKIVEPQQTKKIVQKHDFRFNKRLGQNFLIDEAILDKIIDTAYLSSDDAVIEIGPGIGTLTQALAEKSGKVWAVELDQHLLPILQKTLKDYPHVKIINKDVLKLNVEDILEHNADGQYIKVVANLPYYITTPVIMKILEEKWPIERMVVMVQKEVAERMTAAPGSKDYGALTLAIQYYADPQIVTTVPSEAFYPPPTVTSAVVLLKKRHESPVDVVSVEMMFKVIKASFMQRRKTLLNALSNAGVFNISKEILKEKISSAGLDPQQRGETLSLEDFSRLTNILMVNDS